MADADLIIYIKAVVVLLVIWRILTIGIFGQIVGGILSATFAYCLSRRSNGVPKQEVALLLNVPVTLASKDIPVQIKDISAPLYDLKRNPHLKLAISLIIDILSTRFVPSPALFKVLVGQAGFVPIGTFMVQYLYDRPALTAIDIVKARLPFANYVPSCTIGWLIENDVIKQQWLGGPSGPFMKV